MCCTGGSFNYLTPSQAEKREKKNREIIKNALSNIELKEQEFIDYTYDVLQSVETDEIISILNKASLMSELKYYKPHLASWLELEIKNKELEAAYKQFHLNEEELKVLDECTIALNENRTAVINRGIQLVKNELAKKEPADGHNQPEKTDCQGLR